MSARRPIVFSDHGPTDVVTAAIVPMDGVTRMPVRSGVVVELWDPIRDAAVPKRLIRNLSGHLVLVDEPPDQELTFRIDATAAGYRGPVFDTFTPALDGVRRVVPLEPSADAAVPDNATVVRGLVVRSSRPRPRPDGGREASPEADVIVTVQVPSDVRGHQFRATTDDRGGFTLVVGLRPIVGIEGIEPVSATVGFSSTEARLRNVAIELNHGRTHVFTTPVDLDDDDQVLATDQDGPEVGDP